MLKNQFWSIKNTVFLLSLAIISCGKAQTTLKNKDTLANTDKKQIITGASRVNSYLPFLLDKNIALVGNPTSIVLNKNSKKTHLVDTLLQHGVTIKKVFAPEHGFRGKANAGEVVKNGVDLKTQLPIISLYGKNKKPSAEVLKGVDLLLFDIQDVGARFYTYISTLHYVMEACAEQNIPVMVLDRPNPNGHYVDGPLLNLKYKSFVGMHPVPIVHGMTIGEYAQMINGEGWLANNMKCKLTVVKMKNYNHNLKYQLPIKPSPNLPNAKSINLYPSLCLFEGTVVSVGRGTDRQFQIYGNPKFQLMPFKFTPQPNAGSKYPKYQGKLCFGQDLTSEKYQSQVNLSWLLNAYKAYPVKEKFFNTNGFFTKLAGGETLQKQIEQGLSETEIKVTWQEGLSRFKKIRAKYLLY